MWGFKRRDGRLEHRMQVLETAAEDLAKCCENNAAALRPLRADMDLQWEKVNRACARLAKRDAVEVVTGEGNGSPSRVQDINQRILNGEPI